MKGSHLLGEKETHAQQKTVLEGKWKKANEGRGSTEDYFSSLAAPVDNTILPSGRTLRPPHCYAPPAGLGLRAMHCAGARGGWATWVGGVPAGVAFCACASQPARPLQELELSGL